MTNGVVYIAFGDKAKEEAFKSVFSMRKAGVDLQVISFGDVEIPGVELFPWRLQSPFHGDGKFSFCAGEVKPYLSILTPFDNTLYLDADTAIKKDFTHGFDYLDDYDICVSYHVKPNGEKWCVDEIFGHPLSRPISDKSIEERDVTQALIGNRRMEFINTGVIFFRRSELVNNFFDTWYQEWRVYSGWDEQMAFHRAICRCPEIKVKLLPPIWNQKYENSDTIIHHHMGKRKARRE